MPPITVPQAEEPNRILDAMRLFTDAETKYRMENPALRQNDPYVLDLQKRHYENILQSYEKRKGISQAEFETLAFVRHVLRSIKAKLKPNFWNAALFNPPINQFLNTLVGNGKIFKQHDAIFEQNDQEAAKKYNLNQLMARVQKVGFKQSLQDPIERALAHNLDQFSIRTNDPSLPNTDFVLHFKRILGTRSYTFDNYDAVGRLQQAGTEHNLVPPPLVNYSAFAHNGFSASEAAAIANNRPVMKRIDGKDIWHSHGIKGFVTNNFDLTAELSRWPIKELGNASQSDVLTNALQGGRTREVHLTMPDGQEIITKVSVAPDLTGLVFRDKSGQLLTVPKKAMAAMPRQMQSMANSLQRANKLATAMSNKRVFRPKIS